MPAKHARTTGRRSSFAFKLEPGAHAPAEARQELLARLPGILAADLIDDVLLLTTELVTNSVRHSPAATDGTVDVAVTLAQERIRVEVSDPGTGFTHVPQHPGTLSEGGRGLFLVEALSDRWGTIGGERTTVWFELGVDHGEDAVGQVEASPEKRDQQVQSDVLELAADLRALASANAALQVRAQTMDAELARVSENLRAGAEALRGREKLAHRATEAP